MAEAQDGRIWWGPIVAERQAREIIAWAAWSLILIGVAPAASLTVSAVQGEITLSLPVYANLADNWYVIGQGLFVGIVMTAAVLLLRSQSWTSALILLLCCVFVVVLLLATLLRLSDGGAVGLPVLGEHLVLLACLGFFTHLVWRAMTAAQALRRLTLAEQFS
ncbi:MAG TPA: hypothetical protein VGG29_17435 [Caulobacteraceae bacterium]|jgi:hypothetical protein